ncbi:MAG: hypothetical protein P9L96_03840 [Candidatus Gygaella obscura]|nr:hypothetical protein [Candidatus Gygaella obscura]
MHWIGYYHLVIFLVSLPMSLMLIIGIVLKIDFFRKLAIGLTWWSLITAPIVRIANLIYSSIELDDLNYVMEYLLDFRSSYTIVLFILLRIYIILVLRKHNAGYLFSRDE